MRLHVLNPVSKQWHFLQDIRKPDAPHSQCKAAREAVSNSLGGMCMPAKAYLSLTGQRWHGIVGLTPAMCVEQL